MNVHILTWSKYPFAFLYKGFYCRCHLGVVRIINNSVEIICFSVIIIIIIIILRVQWSSKCAWQETQSRTNSHFFFYSVHVCISRIIFRSVQLQVYNSWKKCDVNEDCTHLKACPPLKYFLQSADISWAREAILRDKQCGYNSYCCRREGKWLTKSKSFAIIF